MIGKWTLISVLVTVVCVGLAVVALNLPIVESSRAGLFVAWAFAVFVLGFAELQLRDRTEQWRALSKNYSDLNERYGALVDFQERLITQDVVDDSMSKLAKKYFEACENETRLQRTRNSSSYEGLVATEMKILANRRFERARDIAREVGYTACERARDYLTE